MTNPDLTIAYSTLFPRAGQIQFPAPCERTEILVLLQGAPPDAPPVSQRSDIREIRLQGFGVARSRNAAITQARGRYLLFADDDIRHFPEGVARMQAALERDTNTVLLAGCSCTPDGRPRKRYSRTPRRLHLFNSARFGTVEMMIRLDPIRALGLRFDESFGAGTENLIGDEYVFIADVLRAGLQARFLPEMIAVHPADSSGLDWSGKKAMRARGAVFRRVFGMASPFVAAAFALRHCRSVARWQNLRHLLLGRTDN